ncbi:carbohydrate sulfotransferase 15-like [Saccostrea cucullata]|uniref:carbohydrate sulfotransferase 15-like n=1 Tax=Saccostrea cuccullata TaxID=36930 RepID=UPI002ED026B5
MWLLKFSLIFCTIFFLKDCQPKSQNTRDNKAVWTMGQDSTTSTEYMCSDNDQKRRDTVEDILCLPRKQFLKGLKSPCWNNTTNQRIQCLPYFHVIGSTGTAVDELFLKISQHPKVFSYEVDKSAVKEGFWSKHRYKKGTPITLNEFTDLFPYSNLSSTDMVSGYLDVEDFSNTQCWKHIRQNNLDSMEPAFITAHLIRHIQPETKFILMLRHPADRLFDHYMNEKGRTRSAVEFHFDVLKSIKELNNCKLIFTTRQCVYSQKYQAPITESLYDIHLQDWLSVFPRKQVLILRHEDYVKYPSHTLNQVFRFLEIDTKEVFKKHWQLPESNFKRQRKRMRQETREILNNYFHSSLTRLTLLLQDPHFSWNDDL